MIEDNQRLELALTYTGPLGEDGTGFHDEDVTVPEPSHAADPAAPAGGIQALTPPEPEDVEIETQALFKDGIHGQYIIVVWTDVGLPARVVLTGPEGYRAEANPTGNEASFPVSISGEYEAEVRLVDGQLASPAVSVAIQFDSESILNAPPIIATSNVLPRTGIRVRLWGGHQWTFPDVLEFQQELDVNGGFFWEPTVGVRGIRVVSERQVVVDGPWVEQGSIFISRGDYGSDLVTNELITRSAPIVYNRIERYTEGDVYWLLDDAANYARCYNYDSNNTRNAAWDINLGAGTWSAAGRVGPVAYDHAGRFVAFVDNATNAVKTFNMDNGEHMTALDANLGAGNWVSCLLYTSPSPRD